MMQSLARVDTRMLHNLRLNERYTARVMTTLNLLSYKMLELTSNINVSTSSRISASDNSPSFSDISISRSRKANRPLFPEY